MQLRDYQAQAVDAVRNFIKYRAPLHGYVTAPGGSGKSVMIAATAEFCIDQGLRTVVLARNEKLLRQNKAKLKPKYQEQCGIYCAALDEKCLTKPLTVASIQSIARVSGEVFDVALIDEVDEVPPEDGGEDSQYWRFLSRNGDPRIIGWTATPYRTKSGRIEWGEEIVNIPIKPLVDKGYIVPPKNKVGATPDLAKVPVSLGEYDQKVLSQVYTEPELFKRSLQTLMHYGKDREHPLVFCQSIAHADMLATALEANGESVQVVTGGTDKDELSDIIIPDFEEGRFKWLLNCQLLTVGVDIPCIDMVAILRATKSKRLFEQMAYRGTRLYEGKTEFLLLDMGDNLQSHGALGSPWKDKGKGREMAPRQGKVCPKCEGWVNTFERICDDCGYVFPLAEVRKIDHAYDADVYSQPVYEGAIQTYDVTGWRANVHTKRGTDKQSIRISYFCEYGKYGNIAEWISPHNASEFARGKALAFFKKFGLSMDDKVMLSMSLDDLCFEVSRLDHPARITVDHSGEHPRIVSYDFEKEAATVGGLDDDSIPY